MPKFITIYTIRILYKSGYAYEFEVTDFKIKGDTYAWDNYSHQNKPIKLGADDIAAVFQVRHRQKLVWK